MVSCQEPSPLKGRKHSLQHHPHDAALVSKHSFLSMGVEARCCPCHSAKHCQHMQRQPSLHHCCHHSGRCHCNCHCRLGCRCRIRHGLRCPRRCCRPLPLWSPIAAAISVALSSAITVAVVLAVGHCHFCHHRPLQLPSPSAITVAVAVSHCQELLPWRGKNCIRTI